MGRDYFSMLMKDVWKVPASLEPSRAEAATVYIQYYGLIEINEKIQAAMASSEGTDFNDQYFRTTPRFETGDPRYAWLNQSVFVGEGRFYPGFGVEYRVYRVT